MFSKFIKKAKKTSRKEKNSLIEHSVRKLSLKPIFSTLCFARFSLFWMFSRLYSFINGQQDEKSVIKINHHGGKIITLENSFLTPCFLLLHNRHYYSIKNAALLHGQEAQISLWAVETRTGKVNWTWTFRSQQPSGLNGFRIRSAGASQ